MSALEKPTQQVISDIDGNSPASSEGAVGRALTHGVRVLVRAAGGTERRRQTTCVWIPLRNGPGGGGQGQRQREARRPRPGPETHQLGEFQPHVLGGFWEMACPLGMSFLSCEDWGHFPLSDEDCHSLNHRTETASASVTGVLTTLAQYVGGKASLTLRKTNFPSPTMLIGK